MLFKAFRGDSQLSCSKIKMPAEIILIKKQPSKQMKEMEWSV